jgi:hypothetical protein
MSYFEPARYLCVSIHMSIAIFILNKYALHPISRTTGTRVAQIGLDHILFIFEVNPSLIRLNGRKAAAEVIFYLIENDLTAKRSLFPKVRIGLEDLKIVECMDLG